VRCRVKSGIALARAAGTKKAYFPDFDTFMTHRLQDDAVRVDNVFAEYCPRALRHAPDKLREWDAAHALRASQPNMS
jgi:hypothetical protein